MKIGVATSEAARQACFTIRRQVFIEEQAIPEAEEWDALDATALHFLAEDADGPAATARVVMTEDRAKIGRVAVLARLRGTGLGRMLMAEILRQIRQNGARSAVLESQVQAIAFYEKLGFVAEGNAYDDGSGILHRVMRREL